MSGVIDVAWLHNMSRSFHQHLRCLFFCCKQTIARKPRCRWAMQQRMNSPVRWRVHTVVFYWIRQKCETTWPSSSDSVAFICIYVHPAVLSPHLFLQTMHDASTYVHHTFTESSLKVLNCNNKRAREYTWLCGLRGRSQLFILDYSYCKQKVIRLFNRKQCTSFHW